MKFTEEKANEIKTLDTRERFEALIGVTDDTTIDLTNKVNRAQLLRFKEELETIQLVSVGSKDFAPGANERLIDACVAKFDS